MILRDYYFFSNPIAAVDIIFHYNSLFQLRKDKLTKRLGTLVFCHWYNNFLFL